ncbi:MAG1360 family OppF-related protein [Mycoplasmopsis verecunda]|uniref:ABC transporter ATP-binding protein n=1 Tax=Mycoplasmopsis verecunda TaxID=171291 RepID=A0A1T4M4C1_9BACT|nr:hypothetical protein [Mycoplasmopsis verecunda]WPB54733.1 hypothetical protein SAM46_01075 [Mycoplasmopsis verecunda]SJZ61745.1 hypothetical protein SAMN02745154_00624 [Mycoplasmopsis verecunda]
MSKKILTIENIFIKKAQNSEHNKWPFANISIPWLELKYNTLNAFYISNNNTNLSFEHIVSEISRNHNAQITYFDPNTKKYWDFDKYLKFSKKNKEILKKVSYFDINEITNQEDENIPLFELWQDCQNSVTDVIKLTNLNNIYSNLDYTMKNVIFNNIKQRSTSLTNVNNYFVKTVNGIEQTLRLKLNNPSADITQEIENLIYILSNYKISVMKECFEIFKSLKNEYRTLEHGLQTSNINQQKDLIYQSQIKLKYMKMINSMSLVKVENDMKIKDLNIQINFYKQYKASLIKFSCKYIYYQISLVKKQIKILKQKRNMVDILSEEYFDLAKDILIKKLELRIWSRNFNSLKYLTENELNELKQTINSEIKLFILNNFTQEKNSYKNATVSRIKDFIYDQFYFNIKPFTSMSKITYDFINENIAKCKHEIYQIQNRRFNHLPNYKNIVAVHNLEEKIKFAQSELDWAKYSEEKLFNSLLKSKEFKLNLVKVNIKRTQKIALSMIDSIYKLLLGHEGVEQLLTELEDIKLFIINNWIFKLLIDLINYASSKQKASNKFLKSMAAMVRFIEAYENASVSAFNFIKPFKELGIIDKAKIKLTKFNLSKSQILFIKDNMSNISNEARAEFLRVLFNIVKTNNITTIFVTDNLDFIKNKCQWVYFFNESALLEGGKVKDVFHKPIHPVVKEIIGMNSLYDIDKFQDSLYIKENIYFTDSEPAHFVYCTLHQFQEWTNITIADKNQINKVIFSDEKMSNTMIAHQYQSRFLGAEFVLSDVNKKITPEPYDANDNELTNELRMLASESTIN